MTIEEGPEPGGGGPSSSHQDDLESLVRALAEQATAADRRSQELAERVALLEDKDGTASDEAPARPMPQAGRLGSRRVAFAGDTQARRSSANDASIHAATNLIADQDEDNLKAVVGVPEDDVEEALSDRILLIERRLEDYEEEKGANRLDERKYALPESTFTLLITHHPLSVPFMFAVFSVALSISCLCLTLASSIQKGTRNNPLGIPAGVAAEVRAAQFLGALVGVLMEEEIPQGLQLIANAAGHTLLLNGRKPVQKRVIISSIFRLVVGYLFLSSLFMNISQNSDVLQILYDVLALEFVENIDDTTYALAKRGFFGRHMLVATNQTYNLNMEGDQRRSLVVGSTASILERQLSFSGAMATGHRSNHIVRFVYFLNALIILAGLTFVAVSQDNGHYRCNTINVLFDEEIWENAVVRLDDGSTETRLLIYPYFNGIYREEGQHDGYPRYVEHTKTNGEHFGPTVTGAEFIYCNEIGSWIFMHPDVLTSANGEEDGNECQWLWKSYQTQDYDILSTNNLSWEAWVGEVQPQAAISITCNECSERSDCNYKGDCVDSVCYCDETHFGDSCEFEVPCEFLASEKAIELVPGTGIEWNQENPISLWGNEGAELHMVYNRPVYIQKGLSGEPFDMRLYKILEREISTAPSDQPSLSPSVSNGPTAKPTEYPTYSPVSALPQTEPEIGLPGPEVVAVETPSPTSASTPTVGTNLTLAPTPVMPESESDESDSAADDCFDCFIPAPTPPLPAPFDTPSTSAPTEPLHSQNEYDTAPDFADWDDFFESPSLHDLKDILEDYAVAISYAGSRFYGTIIQPNETIEDLFPADYHSFWSQSFDVNRTFIISDTTLDGSPVGLDFFEMRRRVNNLRSGQVQFGYGPYGALIPLMNYEGTGFFHCLDVTAHPSASPSISSAPTTTASPTQPPTDECFFVNVDVLPDNYPGEVSWTIVSQLDEDFVLMESEEFSPGSLQSRRVCLPEGDYRFTIMDTANDGIFSPGYYNVTSYGGLIALGGGDFSKYTGNETVAFSLPQEPEQSASDSGSGESSSTFGGFLPIEGPPV